jgi:hypothetical protein
MSAGSDTGCGAGSGAGAGVGVGVGWRAVGVAEEVTDGTGVAAAGDEEAVAGCPASDCGCDAVQPASSRHAAVSVAAIRARTGPSSQ